MAFTPEQYASAGQWIAANLDDPNLIASTASSLGLTANDLLTAAQTVYPHLSINDVTGYFREAGTSYQPPVYTPEPGPVSLTTSSGGEGGGALASATLVTANNNATAPGGIGLDTMGQSGIPQSTGALSVVTDPSAGADTTLGGVNTTAPTGALALSANASKDTSVLSDKSQANWLEEDETSAGGDPRTVYVNPSTGERVSSDFYFKYANTPEAIAYRMADAPRQWYLQNSGLDAYNATAVWDIASGYKDPGENKDYSAGLSKYLADQLTARGITDVYGGVNQEIIKGSPGEDIPTDAGSYNVGATPDETKYYNKATGKEIDPVLFDDKAGTRFLITDKGVVKEFDASKRVGVQLGAYLDPNSSGGAWTTQSGKSSGPGFGPEGMMNQIAQRLVSATGITDINQLGFREVDAPVTLAVGDPYGDGQLYRLSGTGEDSHWVPLTAAETGQVRKVNDGEGGVRLEIDSTEKRSETYNKETGQKIRDGNTIDLGGWGEGPGMTYAYVTDKDGKPYITTYGEDTTDPFIKMVAKAGPILNVVNVLTGGALTPIVTIANTINAATAAYNGNFLPIVSQGLGFGADMGFIDPSVANTIQTGIKVYDAVDKGNVLGALSTVAGSSLGADVGKIDLGGFTVSDVMAGANALDQLNKGNWGSAVTLAGKLMDSPDIQTAGNAIRLIQAVDKGDWNAAAGAGKTLYGDVTRLINDSEVATLLKNSSGIGAIDADAGGALTAATKTLQDVSGLSTVVGATGNDVGFSAFSTAKQAGLDDKTAFDVSKVVVGTPGDANKAVISRDTTYDPDLVDATAGQDLATKISNANEAVRMGAGESVGTSEIKAGAGEFAGAGASQAVTEKISNAPTFSDAYAAAREAFGPNSTFNYQGKLYSTATFQENPRLGLVDVAGSGRGQATGKTAEQEAALLNTQQALARDASQQAVASTGFFQNLSNALSNQMKLSSDAATAYLQNNPNSPITASVSTALEAAGELQKNVIGGTALMLDQKPTADAFIKGGNELIKMGQSIGTGPQDTKNWNDTLQLIDKAQGFEKLGVIAGRILDGTSGLGRQTAIELRQELPSLFLGGGTARGVLVASGLVDTKDTAGGAAIDAYDDAVRTGKNHNDALADARKAGFAAGATEAAVQLTIGKLGDLALGKLDNVISKGVGRVGAEGVTEGGQEGFASAAVDVALDRDIDVNKALTQAVAGTAVGKSTTATTSPISGVQDATELREAAVDSQGVSNAVNNLQSLYGSDKASTIVQSLTSATDLNAAGQSIAKDLSGLMGDDAAVKTANTLVSNFAVNNAADTMATQGLNVNNLSTVVGNTDSGGTITLGDALGAAITGNGVKVNTSTVVGTKADGSNLTLGELSGVVKGGGTSVTTATGPAVTAGIDTKSGVTTDTKSGVTAATGPAVTAGTDTKSGVTADTGSAVTAGTDTKSGVTTATDTKSGVTTATDTKSGVTTDTKSGVTTATDTKSGVTTATGTKVGVDSTAGIDSSVLVDPTTGVKVDTKVDPTVDVVTQVITDPNATSTVTVDTTTKVTTNVTVNNSTGSSTEIVLNETTGEVVITTKGDDGSILETETTTVQQLTPEQKEKLSVKDPKTLVKKPASGGMLRGAGPQATSKIDMPESVWLGGRFRTDLPSIMAMFPFLFPNAEQQEAQSVSALRRASGVEPQVPKKDDMDYYAYGKEPSIDSVLEPFLNGGSVQKHAQGGIIMPSALQAAAGGTPHKGSHYVQGAGGGQDDLIPARLADGEYVFDAEIVAALGDGSNKEGARRLDAMREAIRKHKRSGSIKKIPPPAKSPLAYFRGSK